MKVTVENVDVLISSDTNNMNKLLNTVANLREEELAYRTNQAVECESYDKENEDFFFLITMFKNYNYD